MARVRFLGVRRTLRRGLNRVEGGSGICRKLVALVQGGTWNDPRNEGLESGSREAGGTVGGSRGGTPSRDLRGSGLSAVGGQVRGNRRDRLGRGPRVVAADGRADAGRAGPPRSSAGAPERLRRDGVAHGHATARGPDLGRRGHLAAAAGVPSEGSEGFFPRRTARWG